MEKENGSVQSSLLVSTRDKYRAVAQGDMRSVVKDVNDLGLLGEKYMAELSLADERIQKKKSTVFYDYDNDWRFKEWQEDKQKLHDSLKLHWIDDMLDSGAFTLTRYLRIGTTLGLMYGAGRAVYLFRTMDKAYCRLHGVGLGSVMFSEVSVAVLKGAVCAFAGVFGTLMGDSGAVLAEMFISNDQTKPERNGFHVASAFTSASIAAGACFCALHHKILSVRGVAMCLSVASMVGFASGWYLGQYVYQPFAKARLHRIDDPHWRKWSERQLTQGGARQVRGRYV